MLYMIYIYIFTYIYIYKYIYSNLYFPVPVNKQDKNTSGFSCHCRVGVLKGLDGFGIDGLVAVNKRETDMSSVRIP